MAYHEQHERKCPYCNERISATAPKCYNCGEYVTDDGDSAEDEEGQSTTSWRYVLLGVCVAILALVGVGISYWLLSGQ